MSGTRTLARLAVWRILAGSGDGLPRRAARRARKADAVLALGGDVPPELLADEGVRFPRVLLARGAGDEWYAPDKLLADEAALQRRGARVETLTFDGAHEWTRDFASRVADILASL